MIDPIYPAVGQIQDRIIKSNNLLRELIQHVNNGANQSLVDIYKLVDHRSSNLLRGVKKISDQVGNDAPELRKLITGRVALILAKLRELNETVLTLSSAVVKINENVVTTNENMVHHYSKWTPWFFQLLRIEKNQSKMLQESEESRRELSKAIDEFHRDVVEELQKSRAESIGGLASHPKRGENESDTSATNETNQAQGVQEDCDFRNDVRDLQSLLAFQQHTTNLALNIIVDLLLPIAGQEHPYPPSLQQKLIQLSERMREVEPS